MDQTSPVYGYLKNTSMVDYPGYLAAVFFTSGCNFACGFCHNRELLQKKRAGIPWEKLTEACNTFRENWTEAAVITGGEPTLHDGLKDLILFFKNIGFKVKLDTNGSHPSALTSVINLVDYVAMDIKSSLSEYHNIAGTNLTNEVSQSIEIIKSKALDYEFRTTIIDGLHTDAVMHDMKPLLVGAKRFILQPFLPREDLPDPALSQKKRTPKSVLEQYSAIFTTDVEQVIVR